MDQLYQAEKKKNNGQLKLVKVNTLSDSNLLLEQEINQIKNELADLRKMLTNHIETTQNTLKIMEKESSPSLNNKIRSSCCHFIIRFFWLFRHI